MVALNTDGELFFARMREAEARSGLRYGVDFPALTIRDLVDLGLVDEPEPITLKNLLVDGNA